jgi:hypothetical protein
MAKTINWLPELVTAVTVSKAENKHVLLDFYNPL